MRDGAFVDLHVLSQFKVRTFCTWQHVTFSRLEAEDVRRSNC